MCTSDPPASTSSRSRQASTWMRWTPAAAARSPIFATGSPGGSAGSCTALLKVVVPSPSRSCPRTRLLAARRPGCDRGTRSAVCYELPRQRTNGPGGCARLDGAARVTSDAATSDAATSDASIGGTAAPRADHTDLMTVLDGIEG